MKWILPKQPIQEASGEQPIAWSQMIYRCPVSVQYEQCLVWRQQIQEGWEYYHCTGSPAKATLMADYLHDLWSRSRILAIQLQKESEWQKDWQTYIVLKLGALWPLSTPITPEMKGEEQFKYCRQLLSQWFGLLQLDWPDSELTAERKETKDTLQQRSMAYLKRQLELSEKQWHACLRKLLAQPDMTKIMVLLNDRQWLLQAIENMKSQIKPFWAKQLQIQLLHSEETNRFIKKFQSLLTIPATESAAVDSPWKELQKPSLQSGAPLLQQVQRLVKFTLALLGPPPEPLHACLAGSIITVLASSASDIDLEILIQKDSGEIRGYLNHWHQLLGCLALPLNRSVEWHAAHTPWQLAAQTWRYQSGINDLLVKSETHARWHLYSVCATPGGEQLLEQYHRYRQQLWESKDDHPDLAMGEEFSSEAGQQEEKVSLADSDALPGQLKQRRISTAPVSLMLQKGKPDPFFFKVAAAFQLDDKDEKVLGRQFSGVIEALVIYPNPETIALLNETLYHLILIEALLLDGDMKPAVADYQRASKELKKYQIDFSKVALAFGLDQAVGLQEFIITWRLETERSKNLSVNLRKKLSPDKTFTDEEFCQLAHAMYEACESKQRILNDLQLRREVWWDRLLKLQSPKNRLEKITKVFIVLLARQQDRSVRFWKLTTQDQLTLIEQEGPIYGDKIDILLEEDGQWLAKAPMMQEMKEFTKKSGCYKANWRREKWIYYLRRPIDREGKTRVNSVLATERYLAMAYLKIWVQEVSDRDHLLFDDNNQPPGDVQTPWLNKESKYEDPTNQQTHDTKIEVKQQKILIKKVKIDLKKYAMGPLTRWVDMLTILARFSLAEVRPYSADVFAQLDFLAEKRFLAEPFVALIKIILIKLKDIRERVHQLWLTHPFHPLLIPDDSRDCVFPPGHLPDAAYPSPAELTADELAWLQNLEKMLWQPLSQQVLVSWQTQTPPRDWDAISLALTTHPDSETIIPALAGCFLYLEIRPAYFNHYCQALSEKQYQFLVQTLTRLIPADSKNTYHQAVIATVKTYPPRRGLRSKIPWREYERAWQQQLLDLTLAVEGPETKQAPQLYWYNPVTREIVYRAMRDSDFKRLFTDDLTTPILDQRRREELGGMRIVIVLRDQHSGKEAAYLKCFPQWPLRQRFATFIDYQLTGDYLPHTQVHLIHPKTGRHYPVIISKARGPALKYRLPELKEMPRLLSDLKQPSQAYSLPSSLSELDQHCFALGAIMSMLLSFGDASLANVSLDEAGYIKRLFVHDADSLFAEAWENKRDWAFRQQKLPGLKSMYFCMPQMQAPIPNTAIEAFCNLSISSLLEQALNVLMEEETQYHVSGYCVRGVVGEEISVAQQQSVLAGREIIIIKKNQQYESGYCETKTETYQQRVIEPAPNGALIDLLNQALESKNSKYTRIITDPKIRNGIEKLLPAYGGRIPLPPMQQENTILRWRRAQVLALAQGKLAEQRREDTCCLPMFFPKQEIARLYKRMLDMQAWLKEQQLRAQRQRQFNPNLTDMLYHFSDNRFATQVAFLLIYHPHLAPHQRFVCLYHPDYIKQMEELINNGHDISKYRSLPTTTRALRTSQVFNLTKDVGQSSSVVMSHASSEEVLQSYRLEEKCQLWEDELLNAYQTYSGKYALEISSQLFAGNVELLKVLLEGQLQGSTVEKVLQNVGKDSRILPDAVQQTLISALREFYFSFQQLDFSNWSLLTVADIRPVFIRSAPRITRLRLVNCHQLNDAIWSVLQSVHLQQLHFLEIGAKSNIRHMGSLKQPVNLPELRQLKLHNNNSFLRIHLKSPQLTRIIVQNCHSLWLMELDAPHLIQLMLKQLEGLKHLFVNNRGWDFLFETAFNELNLSISLPIIPEVKLAQSQSLIMAPTKLMDIEQKVFFKLFTHIAAQPSLFDHAWLMAARLGELSWLEKTGKLQSKLSILKAITDEEGNTALHLAAHYGHFRCVNWLCQRGLIVNQRNRHGQTPLHMATGVATVACLIQHQADITLCYQARLPAYLMLERDEKMNLALLESAAVATHDAHDAKDLWLAAYRNDNEQIQKLLSSGETKLSSAIGGLTPLSVAVWRGNLTIVRQLLEQTTQVNVKQRHQITLLQLAAAVGHEAVAAHLLMEVKTTPIDARNEEEWSALHYATREGHLPVIRQLLEARANVTVAGKLQQWPLHVAAYHDQVSVIPELIQATTPDGNLNMEDRQGHTPLILAVMAGHLNIIKILIKAHADLNYQSKRSARQGAIHFAVKSDQPLMLQYLLDQKAETQLQTKWGRMALHMAAIAGQVQMITMLLHADARINAADKHGVRPLHLTLQNPLAAQALIEARANIHQVDDDTRTALHHVACQGDIAVAEVLIRAKADVNARSRLGRTPLFALCEQIKTGNENKYLPMVQLLLQQGTKISLKSRPKYSDIVLDSLFGWGGMTLRRKITVWA